MTKCSETQLMICPLVDHCWPNIENVNVRGRSHCGVHTHKPSCNNACGLATYLSGTKDIECIEVEHE